jgi:hypothetical protein
MNITQNTFISQIGQPRQAMMVRPVITSIQQNQIIRSQLQQNVSSDEAAANFTRLNPNWIQQQHRQKIMTPMQQQQSLQFSSNKQIPEQQIFFFFFF